jgi:hypothetical protein
MMDSLLFISARLESGMVFNICLATVRDHTWNPLMRRGPDVFFGDDDFDLVLLLSSIVDESSFNFILFVMTVKM